MFKTWIKNDEKKRSSSTGPSFEKQNRIIKGVSWNGKGFNEENKNFESEIREKR